MSPHTDPGALLPCPFCGGKPYLHGPDNPGHEYWISCQSCQASSVMRSNYAAAESAWNTRQAASQGRAGGEAVAWRDIVKQPDERPLPTYGQIPWDQLGRDVTAAWTDRRNDYEFDPSYYPGHQSVTLNFNSLARIVDKYRYYGLPCTALSLWDTDCSKYPDCKCDSVCVDIGAAAASAHRGGSDGN